MQTARWRALVLDAVRGGVLAAGDRGYRPSAATTRALYSRDRRCGFPGCVAAVWFCDADHNRPYAAGGCTDADNCGLLCRRHHRLKTFTAWGWRRTPDGAIEWTDPHGHTWCRDPIRYQDPGPTVPTPTRTETWVSRARTRVRRMG
ncbi:MAG TPA: HNH endonuclease signature motif containing protein [Mycobacteriales bacterium]|nr:HNH endonuclease signature motif containing protein [Mycobacteriales bacterium]